MSKEEELSLDAECKRVTDRCIRDRQLQCSRHGPFQTHLGFAQSEGRAIVLGGLAFSNRRRSSSDSSSLDISPERYTPSRVARVYIKISRVSHVSERV